MPRLRHRAAGVRRHWDEDHKFWLMKGIALASDCEWRPWDVEPMAKIPADVLGDMASAWDHFRNEVMEGVASDLVYWSGWRPWGFWAFDHRRDESIPEAEQLRRDGLLFPGELSILMARQGEFRGEHWAPGTFDAGAFSSNTNTTPEG